MHIVDYNQFYDIFEEMSMIFYVSWYPGDPYYPSYDDDCSLLISISSVSRDWKIKSFPQLPKQLIVDSGGFRYAYLPNESLTPKKTLERQINMLANVEIPTLVCTLDVPVIENSLPNGEKDLNLHRTIANAYEMKNMISQKNLQKHILPMAIIQGHTSDAIYLCANELKAIGFTKYGIGSLALLNNPPEVIKRVMAAASVIPPKDLHIFGINALGILKVLKELGIGSVDSAKPAKAAAFNEILYSQPFRRYGILEPNVSPVKGRIPQHRRLSHPLPCDCPVCIIDSEQIMGVGKRENIRSRTLHNYYHLKKSFNSDDV